MKTKNLFVLSLPLLLCSCAIPFGLAASKDNSSATPATSETTSATPSSSVTSPSSSKGQPSVSSLPEVDHIVVFVETHWTNVWAWDEKGNLFPSWPGAKLSDYDDYWKTYDFAGKTSLNIMFNEGASGKKTTELSIPSKGYWWFYQDHWYTYDPINGEEEPLSSVSHVPYTPPEGGTLDNTHRTWYQLLVYSFADGNGDGIGDFKGIVDHLDYLKNLGIGGIWLSPCHPSADYHGYDVKDYYSIDSKYEVGGVNFAKLIEECHKRDIRVLMDMVLNHTSSQHPWTREHPSWYSGEHVFSGSMPDLNYDNSEVRAEVKNIGKFWLDKGVDGFRCDGAAWIYGGGGSWQIEPSKFEKTIAWWREYATYLRTIREDVYLVGEVWVDLTYIEQYYASTMNAFNFSASYWADEAMDTGHSSSWARHIVAHQQKVRAENPDGIEASFLSNHDVGRYAHEFGGGKSAIALANALNVISPGGSFVYYGDELGMTGTSEGYADLSYRTPMPFASGKTNSNNYMWKTASSTTLSGKNADADASSGDSLYSSLAKVIAYKNANPILYGAPVDLIDAGDTSIGVLKYNGVEKDYYLVLNASSSSVSTTVTGTFTKDFAFETNGSVTRDSQTLTLSGKSFAILTAEGALTFAVEE